jgi:hypothetical protein
VVAGRLFLEMSNVRKWLGGCLLASLALGHALAFGQQSGITRALHPWGNCQPGAWKLVRVTTETLDAQQRVVHSCVTDTKTTLAEVAEDGITLEVQQVVELAGKRFESEPQFLKQAFHGEPTSPELKIRHLGAGEVVVEGRKVPCKVEELELAGPAGKTVTTIHYSETVAPYILKRESVTTDPQHANPVREMTMEVEALDMPWEVVCKIHGAAEVKTVQKHLGGSTLTLAVVASGVPGGVISHSSKEMNPEGRLVRRSTLKLLGYSFEPEPEQMGLFGRKHPNRFRNKPSYFSPLAPPQ